MAIWRWFETPWHPCDVIVIIFLLPARRPCVSWRRARGHVPQWPRPLSVPSQGPCGIWLAEGPCRPPSGDVECRTWTFRRMRSWPRTSSVGRVWGNHRSPCPAVQKPLWKENQCLHDDVMRWRHFPRYWLFVRGINRWPVNSPHKGQWRGAFMFSLACGWINSWVNNRGAGDLRHHRVHYDVTVMWMPEQNHRYLKDDIVTEDVFLKAIYLYNDLSVTEVYTYFAQHSINASQFYCHLMFWYICL